MRTTVSAEFVEFYTFLDPKAALVNPVDMTYVFEPYRRDGNMIDYNLFMQTVFARESETSYVNIFTKADVQWVYPYENLAVRGGLDLERIRRGDTKYLLRDLFRLKYPGYPACISKTGQARPDRNSAKTFPWTSSAEIRSGSCGVLRRS